MDLDLNAAINLAQYAASSAVSACGIQGAGAAKSA
jgi:putative transposase